LISRSYKARHRGNASVAGGEVGGSAGGGGGGVGGGCGGAGGGAASPLWWTAAALLQSSPIVLFPCSPRPVRTTKQATYVVGKSPVDTGDNEVESLDARLG
jgi:hypothetical protein